jgi:PAS domain S-box-containing protein
MNDFETDIPGTTARTSAERHIEGVREQGGIFVEAVRLTRMPMLVTDATLPGNPIVFANAAFMNVSGYSLAELLGQDPHFMNGEKTDPKAIRQYQTAIREGRNETLEILQYRKDGTPFRAMLFASPLDDGQGTVTNHFLSYLDISRRYDAEEALKALTSELEARVALRTRELEGAMKRLAKLVAEKEILVVEVNHRAKNSLAIAAALLGIQGRRQSDTAVKAHFQEAQDRLHAMARVHDLLSRSESSQRVDLTTYLTDLCEALKPLTQDSECVRLTMDAQQGLLIAPNIAVPLGIVLTELVTNAVKYAFPAGRSGVIAVQARRREPQRLEVVIKDDGVGMSPLREGSLGYGLVRSLVEQISGDMHILGEHGVTVTISFPASSEPPQLQT